MKILLPVAEAGSGGLGSSIRGLCEFVPKVLPPEDELVLLGEGRGDGDWLRPSRRLGRFFYEQVVVARAAGNADLVHLPDHRPLLASKTPFLLTVYDVLYLDRPDWFPRAVVRYKRLMLRAALAKRPSMIVTGSDYTRGRLLARFADLPPERVRTIHPGVQRAEPSRDPQADGYFLTVATIEPRKNHLTVLRALRAARERGFGLRWKVAGAAGYAAGPILAELRAHPGVDVLGWVSDDELERLYRGACFLASPSLGEGFGFPPLEAMARGVPVVSATGTAHDESVGEAALRLDPHDEEGWSEALLRLESDQDERARLRALGLQQARGFGWEQAAAAYVNAYHDALA